MGRDQSFELATNSEVPSECEPDIILLLARRETEVFEPGRARRANG